MCTDCEAQHSRWFEYLSGEYDQSVRLLAEAATPQQGQAKALSLYYRGAILNRLGRYDEAGMNLDQALAERADLILAREEKGESLWQMGRKEEAISVWGDAVRQNERLVLANNQLAGAAALSGSFTEAIVYETSRPIHTQQSALLLDDRASIAKP